MGTINFPSVRRLLENQNGNQIWQHYSQGVLLENVRLLTREPFVITSGGINYLLTSNENFHVPNEYEHALLVTKRPKNKDIEEGTIKVKRWLKHPKFENQSPDQVVSSWENKFKFIQEDEANNVKGLRPPQMGALYSILSHLQNPEDKGIVVMPTGTGKTETMLATLISNKCKKLLVSVPSNSLRTQISEKFITLGLLKEFGIIHEDCYNPIVGILNSGISDIAILRDFISKVNVVVTTMDILTDSTADAKTLYSQEFSHLFVDEAHHSEAQTWKELIDNFDKEKVFLFTATPYRNDGKNLQGKIIFNFSLRKAQEQKYYKQINYLPIREYNRKLADEKIAERAVQQLRADIALGYNHIIMARCKDKIRAKEVFKHYEQYEDLNPVMVYTNISGLDKKVEAIKRQEHSIIVCVNMLGEGFDLPNLKIAAIHDDRQSLPITLQFIGRFTRTSYNELGKASFITNIAYPPIHEELEELYARNADWNLILPRLNENATQKEIDFRNYLDGFRHLDKSKIPFQSIRPALSTVIYNNYTNEWSPSKWKDGISNLETYEHQYSDDNSTNTLVIILGKISNVDWGNFEVVKNFQWDIIIVYWDLRHNVNRIFVNTSIKGLSSDKLIKAVFNSQASNSKITGMNVFRVFHDLKRLTLFNVGARRGFGQDITFQNFIGKAVQDGIKSLEQGTIIKNNFFGIGYKDGEKISLGCSVSGKIWSYLRGNLNELTSWCKDVGNKVANESIDPNVVLKNTLEIQKIITRPQIVPVMVDWNPDLYDFSENRFEILVNGIPYDLSNSELICVEGDIANPLQFSFDTSEVCIVFEIELGAVNTDGQNIPYYKIIKRTNIDAFVNHGGTQQSIESFFQEFAPTIWFADGSQLFQNNYIKEKTEADVIPLDSIISDNWEGVNLRHESQDISPYVQDSIQYYFINKIKNDFDIIYDDDGKGEIADIVGIKDLPTHIEIHLFHLKGALRGAVCNDINNFYYVCGQAQKSLNWKYKFRKGKDFFDHLFKRKVKLLNGATCSRFIKGTEEDLENVLVAAKWEKETKFHIYIVQPALSKANASRDILQLLGNTHHYLHTLGNVELLVYSNV